MPARPEDEGALGPDARSSLLALARGALEDHLRSTESRAAALEDPALVEPRSVFVTLRCRGRLRGCIGVLASGMPLADAVRRCAVSAANDPRFAPLQPLELADTRIEISVLSPPAPAAGPDDVVVGRHGVIVTSGMRTGLLLPQVALEQGWDARRFVEEACLKAGLPAQAWRSGATTEVFTAEVFGEEPST